MLTPKTTNTFIYWQFSACDADPGQTQKDLKILVKMLSALQYKYNYSYRKVSIIGQYYISSLVLNPDTNTGGG